MVTSEEQIDTNSPVGLYAIFQRFVELRITHFTDSQNPNMWLYKILLCHALLFGIALCSPVDTKTTEKKSLPEVTTGIPLKVVAAKNINNEQVQSLNNAQTEKSATKKRNIPMVLTDKNDYSDDDFYEGRAEDYDDNQAAKSYLYNPTIENSLFDSGNYKVNDYRYYNEEARRKKTPSLDEIFNKAENYREPEIHLSPEDLAILTSSRQQHRLYNKFPYGHWSDMENSVELPDSETETDGIYDRPENFFDRYYDQRYQNWANLPRNNKVLMNRHRSFLIYPKIRVPIYKRAVL